MKVSVNSKIVNNRCSTNVKAINKAFEQFNGKDVTITIEKKKKKRSEMQNAYYWGVIIQLIKLAFKEQNGDIYTNLEVHEMLKIQLHFKELVNKETGEIIKIGTTTTTDSTVQFEEYEEDCRRWASEWLNIQIPLPNEQIEIEL